FWIELPERVPEAAQETVIETALTAWLKRQAYAATNDIVEHHGRQHDLMPTALRIKAQKRLWGSCTAKGVISLNWRLILGPPEILEYVVVHELCHLRHPHHQPPFWQLVGEVLPDFQRHRSWLRTNGHLLSLKPDRL
ncbi:MAG: M48 family metallopeptidase, partial [Nitrospirota bacterium]|nr:M48 family metallopeptidase [Nitrospirota bacterium]